MDYREAWSELSRHSRDALLTLANHYVNYTFGFIPPESLYVNVDGRRVNTIISDVENFIPLRVASDRKLVPVNISDMKRMKQFVVTRDVEHRNSITNNRQKSKRVVNLFTKSKYDIHVNNREIDSIASHFDVSNYGQSERSKICFFPENYIRKTVNGKTYAIYKEYYNTVKESAKEHDLHNAISDRNNLYAFLENIGLAAPELLLGSLDGNKYNSESDHSDSETDAGGVGLKTTGGSNRNNNKANAIIDLLNVDSINAQIVSIADNIQELNTKLISLQYAKTILKQNKSSDIKKKYVDSIKELINNDYNKYYI